MSSVVAPLLHKYVYGAVPPLTVISMAPVEPVQLVLMTAGVAVMVTLSVPTVNGRLVVQPLASVMSTV